MRALPKHLRPWRRGPYVATLLAVVAVTLAFLVATALVITDRGDDDPVAGWLCSLICVGVGLIAILLPLAVSRMTGRRRSGASLGSNDDAVALLRLGRYEEAANLWEDLCHASRQSPALHALYVFNHGVAQLHRGRLDDAIAIIEEARGSGWFDAGAVAHLSPAVDTGLALALAVRGDVERAGRVAEAVRARVSEARQGMTALVEAVVAARRGAPVEVASEGRRQAEANLMPQHVRALGLLEAFTRSGGDASAYRRAASGDGAAAFADLDFLAAAWPELRAFLDGRRS